MSRFRSISPRLGTLVVIGLLVVACSPAAANTPAASNNAANSSAAANKPAATAGVTVTLTDTLKFDPATLTVPKGTTVTFRNASASPHTVTDNPSQAANKADASMPAGVQPFDSGDLEPGKNFQYTFDTPGTYKYYCAPHETAGMMGTIIVTG